MLTTSNTPARPRRAAAVLVAGALAVASCGGPAEQSAPPLPAPTAADTTPRPIPPLLPPVATAAPTDAPPPPPVPVECGTAPVHGEPHRLEPADSDGDNIAESCVSPHDHPHETEPAPAVVCGPVEIHGEPHATEPVDSDGDGELDACVLSGDSDHPHETAGPEADDADPADAAAEPPVEPAAEPVATAGPIPVRVQEPDEGCVELPSGLWECHDAETTVVPEPSPEPTAEVWGGGGTGWRYDGHGEPVATRVWSQAETKSPWPPAGEGQFELDWMTQCMRENHEYRQERVRRGWLDPSLATYEVTALSCSIHISAAWGPVVLDGRDKACVYEALMNRRVRTISVRNRAWTMWDCPTGPDGTDPDPLRPFEVRCRELVERMVAAGYERAVCVPEAVPARDPANPCNSQRFAAQWLYWAWLRAQGLDNTTKYDWRAC